MSTKPVHEIYGLTELRFGLTDVLNKLREGYEVHVHSYGFDRKPDGIIKLTFDPIKKND